MAKPVHPSLEVVLEPAQLELALVPEAEVERRLSQRSQHRSLLRSAGDHRRRLTGDSAVTERLAICPWWRWPTVADGSAPMIDLRTLEAIASQAPALPQCHDEAPPDKRV